MDSKYVTDDPYEMFDKAENDINMIESILKDKDRPDNSKYDGMCVHAQQAAEKFLKGYIVKNNGKVKKIHDLVDIWEVAKNIDKLFEEIKNECKRLDNYNANARYNFKITIEKNEFDNALKALMKICDLLPIKILRDEYSKKEGYRKYKNVFLENYINDLTQTVEI
jgi:HEPN domain-containing protein